MYLLARDGGSLKTSSSQSATDLDRCVGGIWVSFYRRVGVDREEAAHRGDEGGVADKAVWPNGVNTGLRVESHGAGSNPPLFVSVWVPRCLFVQTLSSRYWRPELGVWVPRCLFVQTLSSRYWRPELRVWVLRCRPRALWAALHRTALHEVWVQS